MIYATFLLLFVFIQVIAQEAHIRSQCYVNEAPFSGDRIDNPIFNGGGFIGSMTFQQCLSECRVRRDTHGRPCVAFEMSDNGTQPSGSVKKNCALAWGCDYVRPWSGGSTYILDMEIETYNLGQCFVNAASYAGDRTDNPIFNGGGFIGSMTFQQCKNECKTRRDPRGRPCVAFEMSDRGLWLSGSAKKNCALAWGCDYVQPWSGGSTYILYKGFEAHSRSQCFVNTAPYAGDRTDNPIFNGGGFIGSMTFQACKSECETRTDPRGRPCVAFEMSDHGTQPRGSEKKNCALAWGCDYVHPWSGGSTYILDREIGAYSRTQCYVYNAPYAGDRIDNPIFNGGGFIGQMTFQQCQSECGTRTDPRGRPCVAFEMSDGGTQPSGSTKKNCALAWGCDYLQPWSGGSVYISKIRATGSRRGRRTEEDED